MMRFVLSQFMAGHLGLGTDIYLGAKTMAGSLAFLAKYQQIDLVKKFQKCFLFIW